MSYLTEQCERTVHCYAQAMQLTAQWYGRSLSRIVADRDLRTSHGCYTALLRELQDLTCHEQPPTLMVTDHRESFWERVVAWLEREHLYLESRWLATDVSFAPSEMARQ